MRVSMIPWLLAIAAPLIGSMAAVASDEDHLHVEFRAGMPAKVRTLANGGRDTNESSAMAYASDVMQGQKVEPLVGYAVRPAPAGCDKPELPCPGRRAALPDDRAGDLPARFEIDIATDLEAREMRHAFRPAAVYSDNGTSWATPEEGETPFPTYEGSKVLVLATDAAKLRPGAMAQADCFEIMRLCTVRIAYSWDLRVSFLSSASGEVLAKQVRAVDAVMRSVIRPGLLPGRGVGLPPKQPVREAADRSYITGLPQDRLKAIFPYKD